ncbi:MAG TPA: sigma-70 family RNA polymerase sigma factor, partial [Firmicutes bacterium]|nr:sigma-70 family RNA polymerase sigma factor [Bacillota bacterium]
MEDRELVGACLRGDTEAFSRLVERYKDAVYGLALSYTNDFDAARDIAQESFIKAFLALRTLSDPAKFGIWLRTITVNQCRMWLRGRRSHIPLDELDEREVLHSFPRPKTPSQIYEAEEIEKLVLDALAKLPERIRQAAVLFYIDGLSMKEIGEFLGISPSAVKQRVYRARKHLKEEMMGMIGEIFAGRRLPEDFTERTVEEALRRGQECLKQRRWEEAREEFRKVVEALPDRPEGHLGIGLAVNGLVEEQKRPGGEIDPDLVREALEELSEAYR